MGWTHENFVYSIVVLSYLAVVLAVARARRPEVDITLLASLSIVVTAGLAVQYLAGFNYAGLVLASVGSGLGLFTGFLLLREYAASTEGRRLLVYLFAGLMVVGLYQKYAYVYRDAPRRELTVAFRTPKLRGITSTERNVRQIDALVNAVGQYTGPGEDIFVFPDFPVLYFLTDRQNPTPIAWYIQLEYGGPMTTRALEALKSRLPKVIFVQDVFELDYSRQGAMIDYEMIPRYRPFIEFVSSAYDMDHRVGDLYVFLPKK